MRECWKVGDWSESPTEFVRNEVTIVGKLVLGDVHILFLITWSRVLLGKKCSML